MQLKLKIKGGVAGRGPSKANVRPWVTRHPKAHFIGLLKEARFVTIHVVTGVSPTGQAHPCSHKTIVSAAE